MKSCKPGSVKYSMAAMQLSFTTSICLGFVKPCIITIMIGAAAIEGDGDHFYFESHLIFWLGY